MGIKQTVSPKTCPTLGQRERARWAKSPPHTLSATSPQCAAVKTQKGRRSGPGRYGAKDRQTMWGPRRGAPPGPGSQGGLRKSCLKNGVSSYGGVPHTKEKP